MSSRLQHRRGQIRATGVAMLALVALYDPARGAGPGSPAPGPAPPRLAAVPSDPAMVAATVPGPDDPATSGAAPGAPEEPEASAGVAVSPESSPTLPEAGPAVRAEATYATSASDRSITLRGDQSLGQGLRYRWVQTRGTRVELEGAEEAVAQFLAPDGPETLEFLLIVAGAAGMDMARVAVPLAGPSDATAALRADAGDDQVGSIGRQVTLNGIRSEPREKLAYRWIQLGGPPVRLKIEDGYVYTFVPQEVGVYRFALVVAAGGAISQPDVVDVTVLASDPAAALGATAPTLSTQELARQSVVRVEGGLAAAPLLEEAFGAIADRISLYTSYGELTEEISRRLDEVVPRDPAQRALWTRDLFAPLTVRLIERLRATGLDLLQDGATEAPLGEPQRRLLAQELRLMASGFRSLHPGP